MAISAEIKMRITTVNAISRYGDVGDVGVDGVGDEAGVVNCIVIRCVLNCVVYHT
jgi:hypothetical protein